MAASGTTRRLPRALSAPSLTRYDSLFSIEMARRQLKSDIENSIDQIKERLLATRLDPRTTTLRELVENELKPEVYGPEKCRDRALACRDRVGVSAWLPGPAPSPTPNPTTGPATSPAIGRQQAHDASTSLPLTLALALALSVGLPGTARSAVMGLLWTNRAVGFVVDFMRALGVGVG